MSIAEMWEPQNLEFCSPFFKLGYTSFYCLGDVVHSATKSKQVANYLYWVLSLGSLKVGLVFHFQFWAHARHFVLNLFIHCFIIYIYSFFSFYRLKERLITSVM